MLRFLSVRHLAVIDRLDIEFGPGLNVLTGETGAGKSLLVEAIDLLIGSRANADLVRTGEDAATVQAIFDDPAGREVVVRRDVSSQGRSRAFIDDALVTATALRDFGASVLSLHGQHEHQALLEPADHVHLVDAYAAHPSLVERARARFDAWRDAAEALERSRLSDRDRQARLEVAAFQAEEIDKVAPRPGEDDALAAERTVLANAGRLDRLSGEAYAALYDGEGAALPRLASVWKRLAELAQIDSRAVAHLDQRDDITSRLEDLAFFLRRYREALDTSPDRLQAVEDRLAALERLKRRYGPSLSDVVARLAALKTEVADLGAGEETAARLAAAERTAREAFLAAARALAEARAAVAARLAHLLERDLAHLAMPSCRVDVRVLPIDNPARWSRSGTDDVEICFSPNPGEEVRPLSRIASGGELSRFMLALRLLTAPGDTRHTLIFDEVDAGIGGAAADAVAARLQALAAGPQVLCVTHLAAIAARADRHFEIRKHVRGGRTQTLVTRLDGEPREREVGRMMAGAAVSPKVLESARELLVRGQRGEHKANVSQQPGAPARGARRGA